MLADNILDLALPPRCASAKDAQDHPRRALLTGPELPIQSAAPVGLPTDGLA